MSDFEAVSILSICGIIFVIWVIPSWVCATAADRKGLTFLGFLLFSLFFTPLLGFLAVIAMPPLPGNESGWRSS